jgi:hypothetical protein
MMAVAVAGRGDGMGWEAYTVDHRLDSRQISRHASHTSNS